ncbi:MAG: flagellar protein FlaG [Alphaproteobacteria bacterium]
MSVQALQGSGASTGGTPRAVRDQYPDDAPKTSATTEPAEVAPAEQTPDKILAALTPRNTRLSIERDEATDRYVFRSVDENTGEVIRQYPTDEMLTQIARVRQIVGLTVDTGA